MRIADSAVRLCNGYGGVIQRVDGTVLRVVATAGEAVAGSRLAPRRPITPRLRAGRVDPGAASPQHRTTPIRRRCARSIRRTRSSGAPRPTDATVIVPTASRWGRHRDDRRRQRRAGPILRPADRAAGDVRGPGRDRHRERPAVRGAGAAQRASCSRGAGAADGDGRGAAGHRLSPTDLEPVLDADRRERRPALRRRRGVASRASTGDSRSRTRPIRRSLARRASPSDDVRRPHRETSLSAGRVLRASRRSTSHDHRAATAARVESPGSRRQRTAIGSALVVVAAAARGRARSAC